VNVSHATLQPGSGREYWLSTLELAVREVFELMLACSLQNPVVPPAEDGLDITAMVGLAGQLCGILIMRCRAQAAAHMAGRMLGVDPDQAGPAMWDAAGEVCNMVAGNFKNKISGLGDGCTLSVPTVIVGGDYRLHLMANEEIRTVLLFEGEPILFTLEVHN
jgi:chemotaxis protein CheX